MRIVENFLLIIFTIKVIECENIRNCESLPKGSSPYFKEIFIGRCYYFVSILHRENCDIASLNANCTLIYEKFAAAVLNNDPCNINIEDFDEFFKLVYHPIPRDKSLFWPETFLPALENGEIRQYWSLKDTLPGYLVNGVDFCSSYGSNTFDESCPNACVSVENPFWNAASIDYAKKASGQITVVLNGTRSIGAITYSSYFIKYEVPNLQSEKVNELKVLLLHSPGQAKFETCEKPVTLRYLQSILVETNIKYSCEDEPDNIIYYMCFKEPLSKECLTVKQMIMEI